MKKLLIGLALSLVATAASAQWVFVTGNDLGSKFYADPATKRRTGNVVRMWFLYDHAKPSAWNGKVFSSSRTYFQYDCVEKTSQALQSALFSGNMLVGEIVDADNMPRDKSYVAPGTAGKIMLDFACK